MRDKIKEIQAHIDNDTKLRNAVTRIRPQRNFWGIAGIVLFFFLPELITYIWQPELIEWAHRHTLIEPLSMQRWLYRQLEEMFISGVSWFNISLGMMMLLWVFRSK